MKPLFTFAGVVCVLTASVAIAKESLSTEELQFFEKKIRPVLVRECYGCHSSSAGNVRGGLRLDTKERMLLGGATGPAVVPGDLEESWLYNAMTHQDYVMPPKRKLPQAVLDDFKAWIEMGAPDPRVSLQEDVQAAITADDIKKARTEFWAYQQPKRRAVPTVENDKWCQNDIDYHILSGLEAVDLSPAEDAEPMVVARRLYFDLIGLPPTPDEVVAFENAWSQGKEFAVRNLTNNLLLRDQFGERWGRHWLDVVRYAESTGRSVNMTFPHAWRYRDYVIDSFNTDKPFDHFIQEQLAGDLLPVETDEEWSEHLIATTFLAIGSKNVNEQNRIQFRADLIDEQIDTTTRVFLGTSVACARCHDHKFDAIPQSDYYALAGVFGNTETYFGNAQSSYGTFSGAQTKQNSTLLRLPVHDPSPFDKSLSKEEVESLRGELKAKVSSLSNLRRSAGQGNSATVQQQRIRTLNELETLSGRLGNVDENGNPRSFTMGVQERGTPKDIPILVRGEIDQPAQIISRGFPQVLCEEPAIISADKSGRLKFAQWVGSDQNALVARVMVNRIWKSLVGTGIVRSMENFGVTGQAPSHPDLLDHLAVKFIDSGWSVKTVIREIVNSRSYRIGTTFSATSHAADPDNALLWRANQRRLDAEVLRDSMLAMSGELDLRRPRGSEVAKAGYTRVRSGMVGDPRQMGRKMFAAMRSKQEPGVGQSGGRPQFRQQKNSEEEMENGRAGVAGYRGRRARGFNPEMAQAVMRKMTHQLDMEDATFRSVYLPIVRGEEPRALAVFDFADSSAIIGQRESSHTADQALYMLNNPFVIQQSRNMAKRIGRAHTDVKDRVTMAFNLAYSRSPSSDELLETETFLSNFLSSSESDGGLAAVCQSLFASAEFRFVD
ncbi:MAG: DUF1553 domain-containing protein [Planctomycetaceae bacterium]|nr:DUF1553 domain-containing protein [Planctomycetaceae bacterium]